MRCSVEGPVDDFSNGDDFWLNASQQSLDAIWDNSVDDVYDETARKVMPSSFAIRGRLTCRSGAGFE